jgi:hypothetical protein
MTFGALTTESSRLKIGLISLLLAGVLLRIWQYAAGSSLWLDEAALARNIIDRSPMELLAPLKYGQVAPPGFLLIQKLIVVLGGASEYALRVFPLICGLASLWLFLAVARIVLRGWAVPYAVGLFALGQPFIYFSSQAKQYAPDVAASLIALLIGLRLHAGGLRQRQMIVLGSLGMILPWLSQPAMLVLFGAGLGLVISVVSRRDARTVRNVLPLLLAWAASAVVSGIYALQTVLPQTREYMDWFWRTGFMPVAPWDQLRWGWKTLNDVFGAFGTDTVRTNGGLGYLWPQLFVLTTVLGFIQVARTRRDIALVLLGALAACLVASVLRLYPLSGRLLVFLVPMLLLATGAGAHALWTWAARRARIAGAAVALVFVAVPIHAVAKAHPPYIIQPLRPVLEELARRRHPGDILYVDYAAAHAFLYYAPRFDLQPSEYVIGRCAMTDRRDYLRQVDRFRGQPRVWVIGTHLSVSERSITVGYLERIGHRLASVFIPPVGAPLRLAAYARLYNLSDPRRLASTTAESHSIPDLPENRQLHGCSGPFVPQE